MILMQFLEKNISTVAEEGNAPPDRDLDILQHQVGFRTW